MTTALRAVLAGALLASPLLVFAAGAEEGASAVDLTAPGIFPVDPGITLVAGWHAGRWPHDPNDNPWVQSWEEPTGVTLDFVPIDNIEKMSIVFASDDYPHLMLGVGGLEKNLIAKLLQEGVVADLRPHLGKGYTPNLDRIFAEKPEALAYMLNPQGQMQSLARFLFLESNYLEQNYMINQRWLDALGLRIPATTGELRDVLIAFRDGDPNGNGKADEIPFAFVANDGIRPAPAFDVRHLGHAHQERHRHPRRPGLLRADHARLPGHDRVSRRPLRGGTDRSGELHPDRQRLQRQGGRPRRQQLRLRHRAARVHRGQRRHRQPRRVRVDPAAARPRLRTGDVGASGAAGDQERVVHDRRQSLPRAHHGMGGPLLHPGKQRAGAIRRHSGRG